MLINPFLTGGLAHPYHLDESISFFNVFLGNDKTFIVFLIEIPVSKLSSP